MKACTASRTQRTRPRSSEAQRIGPAFLLTVHAGYRGRLTGPVIRRTFAPRLRAHGGSDPGGPGPQGREMVGADRDPPVGRGEERLDKRHHLARLGMAQIP